MTAAVRATDLSPEVARARARYEDVKTLFAGLTLLVVFVMMAVVVWSTLETRRLAEESRDTAAKVEALLATEQADDAARQARINAAVKAIAAEQYRALVAHDARTEALLKTINRGVDWELNAPANQENAQAVPAPLPTTAPAPPPVGPPTGVQPAPAPVPAPAPTCEPRGKSGKCRK